MGKLHVKISKFRPDVKKSNNSPVSWALKRCVRQMTMGVGALESSDRDEPCKYLGHVLLTSRKFFRSS